jgi:hypothetical protein
LLDCDSPLDSLVLDSLALDSLLLDSLPLDAASLDSVPALFDSEPLELVSGLLVSPVDDSSAAAFSAAAFSAAAFLTAAFLAAALLAAALLAAAFLAATFSPLDCVVLVDVAPPVVVVVRAFEEAESAGSWPEASWT